MRGVALVCARRAVLLVARDLRDHVVARDVPARGQPGLEQRDRVARIGERLAVQRDADVPRGPDRVDPVERVARVAEQLLVLLEPLVGRVPGDLDEAVLVAMTASSGSRSSRTSSSGKTCTGSTFGGS